MKERTITPASRSKLPRVPVSLGKRDAACRDTYCMSMFACLRYCLCLLAMLGVGAFPAHAKRVALVIGNDNYITLSKVS